MHEILNRGSVIITFDDGNLSVWERAKNVFASEGCAAVAYIVPSFIDSPNHLSLSHVKCLEHDFAWDIYSHTYSHVKLTLLETDQEIHNELSRALEWMQKNQVGRTDMLCYPWGRTDQRVIDIVKQYHKYARGVYCHIKTRQFEQAAGFADDFNIVSMPFSEEFQVHECLPLVDAIAGTPQLLNFYTHGCLAGDTNDRLACSENELRKLIRHCKDKGVNILTFSGFFQLMRLS